MRRILREKEKARSEHGNGSKTAVEEDKTLLELIIEEHRKEYQRQLEKYQKQLRKSFYSDEEE